LGGRVVAQKSDSLSGCHLSGCAFDPGQDKISANSRHDGSANLRLTDIGHVD
jgi:hypothetical protein